MGKTHSVEHHITAFQVLLGNLQHTVVPVGHHSLVVLFVENHLFLGHFGGVVPQLFDQRGLVTGAPQGIQLLHGLPVFLRLGIHIFCKKLFLQGIGVACEHLDLEQRGFHLPDGLVLLLCQQHQPGLCALVRGQVVAKTQEEAVQAAADHIGLQVRHIGVVTAAGLCHGNGIVVKLFILDVILGKAAVAVEVAVADLAAELFVIIYLLFKFLGVALDGKGIRCGKGIVQLLGERAGTVVTHMDGTEEPHFLAVRAGHMVQQGRCALVFLVGRGLFGDGLVGIQAGNINVAVDLAGQGIFPSVQGVDAFVVITHTGGKSAVLVYGYIVGKLFVFVLGCGLVQKVRVAPNGFADLCADSVTKGIGQGKFCQICAVDGGDGGSLNKFGTDHILGQDIPVVGAHSRQGDGTIGSGSFIILGAGIFAVPEDLQNIAVVGLVGGVVHIRDVLLHLDHRSTAAAPGVNAGLNAIGISRRVAEHPLGGAEGDVGSIAQIAVGLLQQSNGIHTFYLGVILRLDGGYGGAGSGGDGLGKGQCVLGGAYLVGGVVGVAGNGTVGDGCGTGGGDQFALQPAFQSGGIGEGDGIAVHSDSFIKGSVQQDRRHIPGEEILLGHFLRELARPIGGIHHTGLVQLRDLGIITAVGNIALDPGGKLVAAKTYVGDGQLLGVVKFRVTHGHILVCGDFEGDIFTDGTDRFRINIRCQGSRGSGNRSGFGGGDDGCLLGAACQQQGKQRQPY